MTSSLREGLIDSIIEGPVDTITEGPADIITEGPADICSVLGPGVLEPLERVQKLCAYGSSIS